MTPEQRITLECQVDDLKTAGYAVRRDLERTERARRGGKTFGVLLLMALLSVFVPLLHFVLPPLFVLGGIGLGILAWLETAEILGGEIVCPNCRRQTELAREAEDWPKIIRCPGCSFTLTIRPTPTSTG